jgi:hypothetical protein
LFFVVLDGVLKNKNHSSRELLFIVTNGNVFGKKIREVMQSYELVLPRKKQFVHNDALIRLEP